MSMLLPKPNGLAVRRNSILKRASGKFMEEALKRGRPAELFRRFLKVSSLDPCSRRFVSSLAVYLQHAWVVSCISEASCKLMSYKNFVRVTKYQKRPKTFTDSVAGAKASNKLERIRLVQSRDKCQANEPSWVPCSRAILLTSRTNVPVSRRPVPLNVQCRQVTNTCYCFTAYMPAFFQIPIHSSSVPSRGGSRYIYLGPAIREKDRSAIMPHMFLSFSVPSLLVGCTN